MVGVKELHGRFESQQPQAVLSVSRDHTGEMLPPTMWNLFKFRFINWQLETRWSS